jgi:maleate isomerase
MRHAGEFACEINGPFWLDKPVLAINTCIYWWSLRQNGIDDKIEGFGSLLLEH